MRGQFLKFLFSADLYVKSNVHRKTAGELEPEGGAMADAFETNTLSVVNLFAEVTFMRKTMFRCFFSVFSCNSFVALLR